MKLELKNIEKTKRSQLFAFTEIPIRFSEVDSMNIVWHGNYVKYIEDGREDFGKKHGISYQQVKDFGFAIPIVNLEISYKKSLYHGDSVLVKTTYVPNESAKLIFNYELSDSKTSKIICTATTTQVFLDADNNMQLFAPLFYQKWKSKWL
jgi:acyl-CoA thioester hydrolase